MSDLESRVKTLEAQVTALMNYATDPKGETASPSLESRVLGRRVSIHGHTLKAFRVVNKLTQGELAVKAGNVVTAKAISNWEMETAEPSINLLLPVCEALGLSLSDLMK